MSTEVQVYYIDKWGDKPGTPDVIIYRGHRYTDQGVQFKVGDYVQVNADYIISGLRGVYGKLVVIEDNASTYEGETLGVEFSRANRDLHNLRGRLEGNHGRWFTTNELVKVD